MFVYIRVWQHVVCMGLEKNNIPDEYLCEVCKPRPIDRKRAKAMQTRRRTELFKDSSSSDSGDHNDKVKAKAKGPRGPGMTSTPLNKKILDRKAGFANKKGQQGQSKLNKKGTSLLEKAKKQYKKRKSSEMASSASSTPVNTLLTGGNRKVSPKKSAIARRKSQTFNESDLDSDAENIEADLEPNVEASQNLRSWIDQYEEAVTNHYSPELRARLSRLNGSSALSNQGRDLRASAIGGPTRCNVSLKGNGVKILTANSSLTSNIPVIECKGRFMLASQYRASQNKNFAKSASESFPPYVFYYSLGDVLEICLDGKTYGNDGRFCRRSQTAYNAELRYVVIFSQLFVYIL